MDKTTSIVLVGFMAAGKTTIGKELAELSKKKFWDTDVYLTNKFQMSIPDFFATFGEECFREAEIKALRKLLKESAVIATGGGVVLKKTNRTLLKESNHMVIYLKADFETIQKRLASDCHETRPLVVSSSITQLRKRYEMRQIYYQEVADKVIDTTGKSPDKIVSEIIKLM